MVVELLILVHVCFLIYGPICTNSSCRHAGVNSFQVYMAYKDFYQMSNSEVSQHKSIYEQNNVLKITWRKVEISRHYGKMLSLFCVLFFSMTVFS